MAAARKIVIGLLLLLSCGSFLTGCGQNGQKPAAAPAAKQEQPAQKNNSKPVITKEQILYRVPQDGSQFLLPEKIILKTTAGQQALDTLKALVNTKPAGKLKTARAFPENTKVLGLEITAEGVAKANFSKELLQKGWGDHAQVMMIYSIVNTLTEMPSIKKVQIMVEGKPVVVLGQMDLADPLPRNTSFLRKGK